MVYRKFKDLELSALGFGAMRLPVKDGNDSNVDEDAVFEMVDYAIAHGINYFDTAWGYHGGNSEPAMNHALSRYPRDKYFLADKFPGYDLSNMGKVEEIFERQLEKCGVDYFDFYLFHNVCELNIDAYLDEKYGIFDYLFRQKQEGKIRHLGFSAHGDLDVMKRFLDAYGEHMEFCQIQLNWLDAELQNAKAKVELLKKRNIPIWVMEPLRGGKLASLSAHDEEILRSMRENESTAAWAFRYLQTFDSVKVTLSGMSDMEQLKQNISTYESEAPLNSEEMQALHDIALSMLEQKILPCTACRYCTSHCPIGLDIPKLLELYNEHNFTGGGFIAPMALGAVPEEKQPSACMGCRSCEAVCPQKIKISEAMSDFASKL